MIHISPFSEESEHANGHEFLGCSNTMKNQIEPQFAHRGAIWQLGKNDWVTRIDRTKLKQGTL